MITSTIREEGKLTKCGDFSSIFIEDVVSFDLSAKIYGGVWSDEQLHEVLDATDQICASFRAKIKFAVDQKLSEQTQAPAHLAERAEAPVDAAT